MSVVAMRGVRVPGCMGAMIGSDSTLLQARRWPLAGKARARAGERDQAGQNGAEQGEEDDCLIHLSDFPFAHLSCASPSSD